MVLDKNKIRKAIKNLTRGKKYKKRIIIGKKCLIQKHKYRIRKAYKSQRII